MDSIQKEVLKLNWDNDVVRIMKDWKQDKSLTFSYDRTINSLLEIVIVLTNRVNELTELVEKKQKPAPSKGGKKPLGPEVTD